MQNEWQHDFINAIKTIDQLRAFFQDFYPSRLKNLCTDDIPYKVFIPKNYLHKIAKSGPDSPLWKQFIPHANERINTGHMDPIGDQVNSPVNRIIHRYKNRVLLTPTSICPIDCRYCFRKNELNEKAEFLQGSINQALEYITHNTSINEVILTGGDPLILSNKQLFNLCNKLASIEHVSFLRLHTRVPVILPKRIDQDFIQGLQALDSSFQRILVVIHTNHSSELDNDFFSSIKTLRLNTNTDLLSQSVLLKGVNDNLTALTDLFIQLSKNGISPYYLHHPDLVKGASHYYLSVEEGRRIYRQLQHHLPGWAIPRYKLDIPGGFGKVDITSADTNTFSGNLIDHKGENHHYNPSSSAL